MLQTVLDDSGKDGLSTAFTLAGYFGSPEQLMDLAEDWDKALKRDPRIDYLATKHSVYKRSLPDGAKRIAMHVCWNLSS